MPRVVPSQIVDFIDAIYPQAMSTPSIAVYSADAAVLSAIINMADDVPSELLTISGIDYANFIFGLESLGAAIDKWNYRGGDDPPRSHNGKSPVVLIRDALCKCPDQNPPPSATGLPYITDPSLRDSILLDIGSAYAALHANDFKVATVIAGAALEALLLWAIQAKGIAAPISGMTTNARGAPENWMLANYIDAVEILCLVERDTMTLIKLAKNFRNLIHPGAAQRLSQTCDRASALAALSALESVARDLQP